MIILILQLAVVSSLLLALVFLCVCFPYPSPLLRRFLPPHKRWPKAQVEGWLDKGRIPPAFLRYFNRNPERVPPLGRTLLAPADGLVTSAEIRGGIRYLVIALSFWDMHVQRSPLSGRVVEVQSQGTGFMDGEGREFAFLREKSCPVQKRLVIATDVGDVAVRLITSLAARRIETWVREGEIIERGQRIGRILLGSTVVLELPLDVRLLTSVGERVRAGETAVADRVSSP